MKINFKKSQVVSNAKIVIGGSKSETNRLLLLQALYPRIHINNQSDSDDSLVMKAAIANETAVIDVHHAGTAMRFLTSYFASKEGADVVLTGSSRMKQRPISILVDALRQLGAHIVYVEKHGYPPLKIAGKKLSGGRLTLDGGISSQYITSLLLIGASLKNGLQIELQGTLTSSAYVDMTLALLKQIGIETKISGNTIMVGPITSIDASVITIESDWSSASYYYSIIALSDIGTQLTLSSYKKDSFQGDSALKDIYTDFGVQTVYQENTITLIKNSLHLAPCTLHLNNTPDLAQTIAVTCLGLGIQCNLSGLHTLKIKETDRLVALQNEMQQLGAVVSITSDSLEMLPPPAINRNVTIATYDDHRMAMAFAPLALKVPITIAEPHVVSKSYPAFWEDLKKIGFLFDME